MCSTSQGSGGFRQHIKPLIWQNTQFLKSLPIVHKALLPPPTFFPLH